MTEDEAKTKWCPFVRITPATDSHHATTNREERALECPGPVATNCIGSACMAWRWRIDEFEAAQEHFEACAPPGSTGPAIEGYCGLAGAPA